VTPPIGAAPAPQPSEPGVNESTRLPAKMWLNRTVLAIGLASLLSDVGHEMATSALPGFLAMLGASSATLGLIEGLADGASSFAKLASGLYSDRLARRKPLAVIGYFMTAAGMASFALATRAWHVALGRVAGWLGRGARSPVRNVLLTEATTKETHGRAFGLERAMDSAGAVLGPLLASVLIITLGLRVTFALTIVPGLMAALAIALLVRERPHVPGPAVPFLHGVRALPRRFRTFLVGVGLAGLGDFSKTLLILWTAEAFAPRFGVEKGAAIAVAFYTGYNVVYALSCLLAGRLADRFPKHRVLAAGYTLAVVPAAALLTPGASLAKFAVVFGASGLYMGFWETVESSSAATYLDDTNRGLGFGVLATVNGAGDLVSSVVVGALWVASPGAAMTYVIATSVMGAAVIYQDRPEPSARLGRSA
jgi:MFS family permease